MKKKVSTTKREGVCIMGLGYVGLTLAAVCADRGYEVMAVDVQENVIARLEAGEPHFYEPGLREMMKKNRGSISYRSAIDSSVRSRTYIIAVGTSIDAKHKPDYSHLRAASRSIGASLRKGDLVILRSTVPPGTTRSIVVPLLEKASALKAGKDFHVVFAPERTVEGNAIEEVKSLPQVIGGFTERCARCAKEFFSRITPTIVVVRTLEEAELVKVMSNAYRDLSFAFANNLALIAAELSIDVNAAIRAANDGYARNAIPRPSPGVGGYCLTKDPYLLTAHSKNDRSLGALHREGRRINESMPKHIADIIDEFCRVQGIKDPTIIIPGLSFKGHPATSDVRFSPSEDLIRELQRRSYTDLHGHDEHVKEDIFTQWGIGRMTSLPSAQKTPLVLVFMHDNAAYRRMKLARVSIPALVLDPWSMYDRDATIKKGWSYANLGYRSFRRDV